MKAVAGLRDRRDRERTGRTIVDGAREVRRAIEAGAVIDEAFVCVPLLKGADARAAFDRLTDAGVRITTTSPKVFEKLAFGERAEGIVAVVRVPSLALDDLHLPADPLVVVLEGVEKPGNLGAVLRSADGAGANALIVADARTDPFNPNVIRASAGTVFGMPLAVAPAEAAIAWLRERGIRIIATRVDASAAYADADLRGPLAIALGSETEGLSEQWAGVGIEAVSLPMLGDRRQPQRVGDRGRAPVRGAAPARPPRRRVRSRRREVAPGMDRFQFVVIGAGPAGEAAAFKARELDATVAVVDRLWFGGSCPHIGCIPSKSLLHSAAVHAAGGDMTWERASARRDYMVNRAADAEAPDDTSHVKALEDAGAKDVPRERPDRCQRAGRGRRFGRRRNARSRSRQRHRRDGFELEGAADRGSVRDAPVDEPAGHAHARAAAQPARAGWRPDRRRARPGLRALRRADDDRPVGSTARPDGHRTKRGGGDGGDPARRR